MKIGIIHSIYKPYTRGGAETVVENVVNGLKNRGEDVFVITLGRENKIDVIANPPWRVKQSYEIKSGIASSPITASRNDNIKVYRIKPLNLFNFLDINRQPTWLRLLWHIIDMFGSADKVKNILIAEKPDLILTHNLKGLGYKIPAVIRDLKIKNIQTIHDMQLLHPSGLIPQNEKLGVLARTYAWACRKLFGSPEVVIFPSHYIKSVYEKYKFFPESERVILGNPVVIARNSDVIVGTTRQSHGVASSLASLTPRNDSLNVLFIGQVEEYKGIFELIEAIKGLPGNLTLNVVGDGKALSEAKIKAQNDPRINFLGRLERPDMAPFWAGTDILVNPSKTPESFGLVIIESYAHGVPVLAANIGALSELVKEGETGFIFSYPKLSLRAERSNLNLKRLLRHPDDYVGIPRNDNLRSADDLKQRIIWCLENREKLKSMKEACFQEAKKYNIDSYIDKLIDCAFSNPLPLNKGEARRGSE